VAVLTGTALVLPVLCSLPNSRRGTTASLSTMPRLAVAEDRIRKKQGSMLSPLQLLPSCGFYYWNTVVQVLMQYIRLCVCRRPKSG
jgi:hypothetical protein